MEIKRIKEESFESIAAYLNVLLPETSYINDLCSVSTGNKYGLVTIKDGGLALVLNEDGNLNPYTITLDEDGNINEYKNDEYEYELSLGLDNGLKGIRRQNHLTGNINQIVYTPAEGGMPRTMLDYYQYLSEQAATLIYNYDVTSHSSNLSMSLSYLTYHEPEKIILMQLLHTLFNLPHKKEAILYKIGNNPNYYKCLFRIANIMFPDRSQIFRPEEILEKLGEMGFTPNIPNEMTSLLGGTNDEVKKLQLIANSYYDYIKRQ